MRMYQFDAFTDRPFSGDPAAVLLGRGELLAYQASRRGGWLECALAGDRVFLTGGAVTFMQARLFLHGVTS